MILKITTNKIISIIDTTINIINIKNDDKNKSTEFICF